MPGVAAAAAEWSQTYNGNLSESIATTTMTTTSHRSRGAARSTRLDDRALRPRVFALSSSSSSPASPPR
eukprot:30670-Pelagococcus_subviridis.AAC.3